MKKKTKKFWSFGILKIFQEKLEEVCSQKLFIVVCLEEYAEKLKEFTELFQKKLSVELMKEFWKDLASTLGSTLGRIFWRNFQKDF